MDFSYVLDKLRNAEFCYAPFRHISISDFFSDEHFAAITSAPEVDVAGLTSDEALFRELFERSYKIIGFPGCITDKDEYIEWHKTKRKSHRISTSVDGFGIALRLTKPTSPALAEAVEFFQSEAFRSTLIEKFGLDARDLFYDAGLQKYLDGYEISPHPDNRKKALTYMVNVTPGEAAEELECHTHYLKMRDEYAYVQSFWAGNADKDRCWVPWSWCDTQKVQRENNSVMIFSPHNDTLHAVKADYDHLRRQRTQFYGNFWYHADTATSHPNWTDLVIGGEVKPSPQPAIADLVMRKIKRALEKALKAGRKVDPYVIADRLAHK